MHSGYPWDPENRSKWQIASEPWQLLLQHWRNATDPLANRNSHTLTIVPPHITTSLVWETLVPILRQNEHGKILVLNSYPTMVERVFEHYKHKPRSGVLITGQLGIGKSVSLCYLLAILLNRLPFASAPVLFYCHDIRILFYGDKAYKIDDEVFRFEYLPQAASRKYHPVWALIDIDDRLAEPEGLEDSAVFAVLAASPNPIRYRRWSDSRDCAEWGLPLWTAGELSEGKELQMDYSELLTGIRNWLNTDTSNTSDDASDAIAYEHHLILDAKRAKFQRAEDAVEYLLKYAQKHYGRAARDVYGYLRCPARIAARHSNIFTGGAQYAWSSAMTFTSNFLLHGIADSHRFIAIDVNPPRTASDPLDTFSLGWKSTYVKRKMMKLAEELDDVQLAQWFSLTYRNPASATFASHIYEVYVHRTICSGAALLLLQPMRRISISDEPDRVTYSTTNDTSSKYPPFPICKRHRSQYSPSTSSARPPFTPSFEHYYVPKRSNDSLFGSFLFFKENDKIVLLILQISLADVHLGSSKGLDDIKTLKERAGATFGREIEVRYVLVCPVFIPTDRHPQKWKLPTKGLTQSNQGSMYYLGLPLPYVDPQIENWAFKEKELKGKEREEQEERDKVKQAEKEQDKGKLVKDKQRREKGNREREQEAQATQVSTKKRKVNEPENPRKKNKT